MQQSKEIQMQRARFADPIEHLDTPGARAIPGTAGPAPDTQLVPMDQQNMATPFAEAIMARRGDVKRDVAKIKLALKAEAAAWGNKWIYAWDVNDKRNNRKVRVEGGTIKMANAIARLFGNCIVEPRVFDEGTHWTFYARFVDLETGYTLVRAYRQRKDPNIGMKDEQRALDMVFAIGQSKAIRNVVLNALPDMATFCMEEAKAATISEIQAKPDGARKWILKKLEEMGVERRRVEAIYGRDAEHWTVPDMAKIVAEVESVEEGMMAADDVWPVVDQAPETGPAGAGAPSQPSGQGQSQPSGQGQAGEQRRQPSQRRQVQPQPQAEPPKGPTLNFYTEDGTRLPYDTQGNPPKAGDFIEIEGQKFNVLALAREEATGVIQVTIKPFKVVVAEETLQKPSGGPAGPRTGTPASAQATQQPAKRNLFGKKGG